MRGLNTTRPAGNSATATAPITPADSKFLLILFLPYNKLSIWYVGSRTSEPSKANLCNRRSVVGQSKVVKYLKFGRMLRICVLPKGEGRARPPLMVLTLRPLLLLGWAGQVAFLSSAQQSWSDELVLVLLLISALWDLVRDGEGRLTNWIFFSLL